MNSETADRPAAQAESAVVEAHPAWEWSGIVFVGAVIAWLLHISWRKWPDALIDFGRELYLPWRLSEGAVLYRDMSAAYGPLSQCFNALIFRVTGVGYMHLVWANLVIYFAILTLIYRGLRTGWGRLAAFAGTLVFVTVFSFNQLVGTGNYNFLSPYSHESTHGFLLILILLHLWASWLREPRYWKIVSAGLVCGLCALLKVEIIFVAAVVTAGAAARLFLGRQGWRSFKGGIPSALAFLAAGCLPSLIATLIFRRWGGFSFSDAFLWANTGWTGLFLYWRVVSAPIQMQFLGLSDIPGNLAAIFIYGGASVGVITGLAAICRSTKLPNWAGIRGLSLLVISGLASYWLPWMGWGYTFPAFLGLALFIAFRQKVAAGGNSEVEAAHGADVRWLFLLAAGAFLARMSLNPRIYHYGYFQAALAGVVITATCFRSIPDFFKLQKSNRILYLASLGVFLGLGLWNIEERSRQILALKTQPVGEGSDQFFGFSPQVNPDSILLENARGTLLARGDCQTLLVVPEGVMLNYLLRKPAPISAYSFSAEWLDVEGGHILKELQSNTPDYVVMISRDLSEFGMDHFGDSPKHGAEILSWIRGNYEEVWHAGGDPLNMNERGAMILRKSGERKDH